MQENWLGRAGKNLMRHRKYDLLQKLKAQNKLLKNYGKSPLNIKSSPRLSYRLMDMSDANLLYDVDQDPKVMTFISGGVPSSMALINSKIMPRLGAYLNPEKAWGIWQVNITESDEFIGWILVRPMDFFSDSPQFDNLELGWRFKSHSWGKGYATESAKHVMVEIALTMGIQKFCAIADPKNAASIKVMEKIGMQYGKTYFHEDPLFSAEMVYYHLTIQE